MVMRVEVWGQQEFKENLTDIWQRDKEKRKKLEEQWKINETALYRATGVTPEYGFETLEDLKKASSEVEDQPVDDIAANYILLYIRYNHSIMSSNPPDVVFRAHPGLVNKSKAEDAEKVKKFLYRKHSIGERFDERNLKTLTKGTGYLRSCQDPTAGDVLLYNETTGEMVVEGEERVYSPSTWNIWIDANAHSIDDVRHFWEYICMRKEEAKLRWPDYAEEIDAYGTDSKGSKFSFWNKSKEGSYDPGTVDIFLYMEKGHSTNGGIGRMAFRLGEDGPIMEWGRNPNPGAKLGLDILTDIDVEDEVYGKSIIEYLEPLQEMIMALDTNDLSNIAIGNIVRLLVDGSAEIDDQAPSDSQVDVISLKNSPGMESIRWLQPPNTMPDSIRLRNQFYADQKGLANMNDAMTGQLSRETSGYTFDRSIESAHLGRRRLYNKFTLSVERFWLFFMDLAIQGWKLPKLVKVVGNEGAYDIQHIKGSDIDGGWEIEATYGRNFSLDPEIKRQQLLQYVEIFKLIPGFDWGIFAREMGLQITEDNMFQRVKLAHRRQQKIFDTMISGFKKHGTSAYIAPKEFEDHVNMYDYCKLFYMMPEFEELEEDLQLLIEQHMMERREKMAQELAEAQSAQAQPI